MLVNVLTPEGCYLLHGPRWTCYVTRARSVLVLDSCISFRLLVCLLQVFVNVLTLEGCYLLHSPGGLGACYVIHARSVLVLDSCISFSLFVCLFITGVCKCSHPRGVPWRGVLCCTYVRGVYVVDSCIVCCCCCWWCNLVPSIYCQAHVNSLNRTFI